MADFSIIFLAGFSLDKHTRTFTIDGAIYEPLSINREKLLEVIAPQVPATLTVTENGESWYLALVPMQTPEISAGNGVQQFQMRFHAAYPYWRTSTSYAEQIAGLTALFKFPFYTGGAWWISKFDGNYFKTVVNKGNVPLEVRVVFTARGELRNPQIYNVDTAQLLLIKKTMTEKESLTISTVYGERGVAVRSASGEISNGFRYLSIDSDLSFVLNPGKNLLRIDAQNNREALGARLEAPEGVKSGV